MLDAFSSQGVEFDAVFVCPHRKTDGCDCRKPKTRLVDDYVRDAAVDLDASAMIGDRDTDLEFARNLGVRGLLRAPPRQRGETWPAILRDAHGAPRARSGARRRKPTSTSR